jgi:hypothetical protein
MQQPGREAPEQQQFSDEPGAEDNKPQKVSSVENVQHGNLDILFFPSSTLMITFTFQWYLTDTIQTTKNNLSKVSLHNKPKKVSST